MLRQEYQYLNDNKRYSESYRHFVTYFLCSNFNYYILFCIFYVDVDNIVTNIDYYLELNKLSK